MSQATNRSDSKLEPFDNFTDAGDSLPTKVDRRLARLLRELDVVRRVSWYTLTSTMHVHAVLGVDDESNFFLDKINAVVEEEALSSYEVQVSDNGSVFVKNTLR